MTDRLDIPALDLITNGLETSARITIAIEWGLPITYPFRSYRWLVTERLRTYPDFNPDEWQGWWWEALLGTSETVHPRHRPHTVTIHEAGTARRQALPKYRTRVGVSNQRVFLEQRPHP